jgi:hypothetical protein
MLLFQNGPILGLPDEIRNNFGRLLRFDAGNPQLAIYVDWPGEIYNFLEL